jgi:hypothetical protein
MQSAAVYTITGVTLSMSVPANNLTTVHDSEEQAKSLKSWQIPSAHLLDLA